MIDMSREGFCYVMTECRLIIPKKFLGAILLLDEVTSIECGWYDCGNFRGRVWTVFAVGADRQSVHDKIENLYIKYGHENDLD